MKIRRYWMDMDYPYHPPPEYVMSGYVSRSMISRSLTVPAGFLSLTRRLCGRRRRWTPTPAD